MTSTYTEAQMSLYQGAVAFLELTKQKAKSFKNPESDLLLAQIEQLEKRLKEVYQAGDLREIKRFSDDLVHLGEQILSLSNEPLVDP